MRLILQVDVLSYFSIGTLRTSQSAILQLALDLQKTANTLHRRENLCLLLLSLLEHHHYLSHRTIDRILIDLRMWRRTGRLTSRVSNHHLEMITEDHHHRTSGSLLHPNDLECHLHRSNTITRGRLREVLLVRLSHLTLAIMTDHHRRTVRNNLLILRLPSILAIRLVLQCHLHTCTAEKQRLSTRVRHLQLLLQ
jgi:hypothetical protein